MAYPEITTLNIIIDQHESKADRHKPKASRKSTEERAKQDISCFSDLSVSTMFSSDVNSLLLMQALKND